MKRAYIALLVSVAVGFLSFNAHAQDMSFGADEADGKPEKGGTKGSEDQQGAGGETGGGDVIGELAASSKGSAQNTREGAPRTKEVAEEVYAVQQIYALRNSRLELSPSIAFTVNDPFISHPAPAIALNYWWTNVLAIGLNFLWYQGLEDESDLNFFVRRSTRLAVPITEYQMGLNLNFTYVPLYGKFAMFNEYIFQWDAYVVGGVGLMRTRPVPVVDPEIRQFDYDWRVAFNAGIGIRVFLTRFLAVFTELRDYAYLEQRENLNVGLGADRTNPDTWLADSPSLTNNVTIHLGLTLFFPFTFEYKLPK